MHIREHLYFDQATDGGIVKNSALLLELVRDCYRDVFQFLTKFTNLSYPESSPCITSFLNSKKLIIILLISLLDQGESIYRACIDYDISIKKNISSSLGLHIS